MDPQLLNERVQIFKDALVCKKPSRIPTLGNAWGWKLLDTDIEPKPTFFEATSNWDITEKIVREHLQRYRFDTIVDVGFRFNSSFKNILGDKIRHAGNGGQALDTNLMLPEDYDEMALQGSSMFEYTTLFPRLFKDITLEQMEALIKANALFGAFVGKMYGALVSDYSSPILSAGAVQAPMEELFNYYRGIKGLLSDMRRCPEKILAFIDDEKEKTFKAEEAFLMTPDDVTICHFTIPFLAPTVLNTKQFEKFYLPTFKEIIEKAVRKNKAIYLFIEGQTERFINYLQDYSHSLIIHVEMDDFFEIKKKLPNICLAGGMPVDILGGNDKQRCLDFAKQLCAELGGDGFIFSQNKMMAYPYDGTRENMLAVQDFVMNFKL